MKDEGSFWGCDWTLFRFSGTGACMGDSGGGMYFEENKSYTLRGIVSQTRALSSTDVACDPEHYVVFTDVAQYLDWIQKNM